ncbi:phosphotransferase, partial [Micromonospora sp. LOL_024]|uniref:phosphotransferase n=1 Tax=Micromonospora sp. LOL_024 TaxID=3345412 RepID=UPI003A8B8464
WATTKFMLGEAVLHGDAHMENLLVTADGREAFVDLETVCIEVISTGLGVLIGMTRALRP